MPRLLARPWKPPEQEKVQRLAQAKKLRRAHKIDQFLWICSDEYIHANRLRIAIKNLAGALRETEAALEELHADSDPLAVHIFVARRQYRNVPDTKGGKRSEIAARLSWQTACELGYRGSLAEWERLMGASR